MNRVALISTCAYRPSGQATLSLVFLIGGIIVVIGLTVSLLALSFMNSSLGYQASNRALAAAQAGIEDAYIQLIRNKDFAPATSYSFPVGTYTATVTVTQNSPTAGQVRITASSTVLSYERSLQAIVAVSSSTGEMSQLQWTEVAL